MTQSRTAPFPLAFPLAQEAAFTVTFAHSISEVDSAAWDALASRDTPHMRYGFLEAVETSGFGKKPIYLQAWRDGRLLGATVAYVVSVDLLTLAPKKLAQKVNWVRDRWAPGLLQLSAVMCGPLITNCNHNFMLSDELTDQEQREVIGELIRSLEAIPGASVTALIEFNEEACERYGPPLEERGFFKAPSLPGTRLEVKWRSLEEYTALMRKAFRRTALKDRHAAEGIEFEIVDDFTDIAEEAYALYENVLAKADHVFEKLTPDFFRALARFDQARLCTARLRETGRLVGIELLLEGDTVLQDLYTGLDYSLNADYRLYFNLLYPVIGYAGERRMKTLSLGQTSYTFKARLGVQPYPLFLYVKHRNGIIHRILSSFQTSLFPETETQTFHVFRDAPNDSPTEAPERVAA